MSTLSQLDRGVSARPGELLGEYAVRWLVVSDDVPLTAVLAAQVDLAERQRFEGWTVYENLSFRPRVEEPSGSWVSTRAGATGPVSDARVRRRRQCGSGLDAGLEAVRLGERSVGCRRRCLTIGRTGCEQAWPWPRHSSCLPLPLWRFGGESNDDPSWSPSGPRGGAGGIGVGDPSGRTGAVSSEVGFEPERAAIRRVRGTERAVDGCDPGGGIRGSR